MVSWAKQWMACTKTPSSPGCYVQVLAWCTGERIFEFFTPAKLGQHRLFFTCSWTLVIFCVFFYMVGEFPYFQRVQAPNPSMDACLLSVTPTAMGYGSSQLLHWLNQARVPLIPPIPPALPIDEASALQLIS